MEGRQVIRKRDPWMASMKRRIDKQGLMTEKKKPTAIFAGVEDFR